MQHEVALQPTPSRRAAFFDVDGTLLELKSMFAFQAFYWQRRPEPGTADGEAYRRFVQRMERLAQDADRSVVNRAFYESFAGREPDDVASLSQAWFEELIAHRGDSLFFAPALALAERLRAEGFRLVAVSGSSMEILAPLMRHLRFDDCLATRLVVQDGRYTGQILPPQTIGAGKADAIAGYLRTRRIRATDCVACGDHASDAPMLLAVGSAFVRPGDPVLDRLARTHGWQRLPSAGPEPSSQPPSGDSNGVHVHA